MIDGRAGGCVGSQAKRHSLRLDSAECLPKVLPWATVRSVEERVGGESRQAIDGAPAVTARKRDYALTVFGGSDWPVTRVRSPRGRAGHNVAAAAGTVTPGETSPFSGETSPFWRRGGPVSGRPDVSSSDRSLLSLFLLAGFGSA
jgi:hypothetical protein